MEYNVNVSKIATINHVFIGKYNYFATNLICGIGSKQISEHGVALIQITPTFWEVSSSPDKYLSRNEQQQQLDFQVQIHIPFSFSFNLFLLAAFTSKNRVKKRLIV